MFVLGNEFRALVIKPDEVVAFVPSDSEGKKRTGMTVRLHNESDTKLAATWLPTDRIFYYHDVQGDKFEGGFYNERTKERIRVS
jgi:hypothetical protein